MFFFATCDNFVTFNTEMKWVVIYIQLYHVLHISITFASHLSCGDCCRENRGTDGAIKPRVEAWPSVEEEMAKEMQSTSRASPLLAASWFPFVDRFFFPQIIH